MAHPTPEEKKETIHGPGFALAIAQQSRRESRVLLVPVMAKLISCKSRFRDRCYRGRLAVSVRVRFAGSVGRRPGTRRRCFLFHRRTIVRTILRGQQDVRHRQVPQCYRDAFGSYIHGVRDSNFLHSTQYTVHSIMQLDPGARWAASSPCLPWLRNPRGGAVCNLQGSKHAFLFFSSFDEEAHCRSEEGPTSLAHHRGGLTVLRLRTWVLGTSPLANDRKTWGRWIAASRRRESGVRHSLTCGVEGDSSCECNGFRKGSLGRITSEQTRRLRHMR